MRMSEIPIEGQPPVDGYAPGGFRIAGLWHAGHVLLLPGGVTRVEGLEAGLDAAIAAGDALDLLLLGQGPDIAPVPAALRSRAEAGGLALEPMATPSACRTYNVLLTEDRRVGALLLAL